MLRNWRKIELQVPGSWEGRAALTESTVCVTYPLLITDGVTNYWTRFKVSLLSKPVKWDSHLEKGVHKRDYLWTAPWSDGPHRLFEQFLGFPVLPPAYED